jgi:meso-butanediol dehydrogenase / (S,S)-butanediol dehydrogenase / diacetyl reductase
MIRFDGKSALITGAGSGIGAATAIGYARGGGRVGIVDVDGDAAAAVAEQIRAAGGEALSISADLTDAQAIADAIGRVEGAFGRIDFLHNNAFGLPAELRARRVSAIESMDEDVWHATIQIGLTAVMRTTRAVIPIMRRQGGGAIVNTASIAAFFADRGGGAYNTIKAGVVHFTRVTAVEGAGDGIRANSLCPGAIDTPLLRRGLAARDIADPTTVAHLVPLGRVGRAEEAANAALFLASDLASFITGIHLTVDGGLNAAAGGPPRSMK